MGMMITDMKKKMMNSKHEEDEHKHEEEGHDEHGHEGHAHGEYDPHIWLDPINANIILTEMVEI